MTGRDLAETGPPNRLGPGSLSLEKNMLRSYNPEVIEIPMSIELRKRSIVGRKNGNERVRVNNCPNHDFRIIPACSRSARISARTSSTAFFASRSSSSFGISAKAARISSKILKA